jgi:hypothetical protein
MMQAEPSGPQIFAAAPRFLTYGLSAGLIIVGCCLFERRGVLPTPKALVLLGDASFAIYLVHYAAVSLALAAMARLHVRHIGDLASSGLTYFRRRRGSGFLLSGGASDQPPARRPAASAQTLPSSCDAGVRRASGAKSTRRLMLSATLVLKASFAETRSSVVF